jgi:hypothetical protein
LTRIRIRHRKNAQVIARGPELQSSDDLTRWLRRRAEENSPFNPERIAAEAWAQPAPEDIRKLLSLLRKKLHLAGLSRLDSWLLPQRGRFGIRVRVNAPTA